MPATANSKSGPTQRPRLVCPPMGLVRAHSGKNPAAIITLSRQKHIARSSKAFEV